MSIVEFHLEATTDANKDVSDPFIQAFVSKSRQGMQEDFDLLEFHTEVEESAGNFKLAVPFDGVAQVCKHLYDGGVAYKTSRLIVWAIEQEGGALDFHLD